MAVVGGFIAFVITVLFLFALRPVATAAGLVDLPGGRKKHGAPVPVIGGIAMALGLAFGTSLIEHPDFWDPTLLGVYLLVVVGTIDDRFDLPANVRLIAQTCAALLVVFASGIMVTNLGAPIFFEVPLGIVSAPFTILFIVTLINSFNMIDGIDGLAGGLAMLSLVALAAIGADTEVLALILLLVGVVGGFLLFNLPLGFNQSVRTFMGDAGSTFLGSAIAAIGIWLCQGPSQRITPVIGLWLVAVPVFDLFSAIVRRLVERKPIFTPDHEHLHHVLVENGLSRRATLVFMLALGALFAIVGIAGDVLIVPDGIMLIGWLAAGTAYYQMLRRPRLVVSSIESLAMLRERKRAKSM
jgi:UDP-GlcNAc:undecaprenyl-phosphate GlcNAc-1-phosphate transferase